MEDKEREEETRPEGEEEVEAHSPIHPAPAHPAPAHPAADEGDDVEGHINVPRPAHP